MKNHIVSSIRTATVALLTTVSAISAQTLVSDNFSNGVPGNPVNGTTPQIGSGTWVAESSAVFSNTGTVITEWPEGADWPSFDMRISIPSINVISTVSASIVTNTTGWIGVGFYNNTGQNMFSSPLFLLLQPNGSWAVYENGTTNQVIGGTLVSYDSAAPITLSLSLNANSMQARAAVMIDGQEISLYGENQGWFDTNVAPDSSILAAGVRNQGIQTGVANLGSVDDFLVVASVPEPSSLALGLVALTVFCSTRIRQKNRLI